MCKRLFATLVLTVLIATPVALAQDPPQMVSVLTVHTKLGHQQHYEGLLADIWGAFRKAGLDVPIQVSSGVSAPGDYVFAVPISGLAQLDEVNAKVQSAYASIPKVMEEIQGTITHQDQSVWVARPDLSYSPSSARLSADEAAFTRVTFIYPHPEHALHFEGQLQKSAALRKKHGISDGTAVFQLVIGADAPAFAVLVNAKDEVDFAVAAAKTTEKLGAGWQAILQESGPMIRRLEYSTSAARPGLAFTP